MNWSECIRIPAVLPEERDVVVSGNLRFTVFSERTIRIEYSPSGHFTDAPSRIIFNRKGSSPEYSYWQEGQELRLETGELLLRCRTAEENGMEALSGLSIRMKKTGKCWHYGETPKENLKGTRQTLDNVDGAAPLEEGLLNREGYTVLNDSSSVLLDDSGWPFEREENSLDLYFFYYGEDYPLFFREYFALAGGVPTVPRWALGNWWSRFYPYTQKELLQLMDDFRKEEVPLSVCIIDMDWHIRENEYHEGWTGYTWNRELLPEPERLLDELHKRGLKTALNLHPADGVAAFEEDYEAVCEDIGLDAGKRETIPFALDDRRFAESYFKRLHHTKERQGVDFWWMDWQQENAFSIKGLDTLWWINHLHYRDQLKEEGKTPLILSRWSGFGSHRYPIQFSGDTIVTWDSLAFQPYFTANAANAGCFWWSHDIGGHMGGIEDGELYLRWVQFGIFSPVFRLHSSDNEFQDRRPWNYEENIFTHVREAMQLRHMLIPYLYSEMFHLSEGCPIAAPMYYYHKDKAAYEVPQQYYFGRYLIAAPYTRPMDKESGHSHQAVWLPEGNYYDFFTGESLEGGRIHGIYGTKEHIPVFARAGAIIPMAEQAAFGDTKEPEHLRVMVFCGDSGQYVLREGKDGERATRFAFHQNGESFELEISGEGTAEKNKRSYHVVFVGTDIPEHTEVTVNQAIADTKQEYVKESASFHLTLAETDSGEEIRIFVNARQHRAEPEQERLCRVKGFLRHCRISNALKKHIYHRLLEETDFQAHNSAGEEALFGLRVLEEVRQLLPESVLYALAELLTGCGCEEVTATGTRMVLAWNPEGSRPFTYNEQKEYYWEIKAGKGKVEKVSCFELGQEADLDKRRLEFSWDNKICRVF